MQRRISSNTLLTRPTQQGQCNFVEIFTQCHKVNFLIERLVSPPSIPFFHNQFEYLKSLQNKDQIQKYFQSEVQFQWILYIFCPIDYGVGNSNPWGATLANGVGAKMPPSLQTSEISIYKHKLRLSNVKRGRLTLKSTKNTAKI